MRGLLTLFAILAFAAPASAQIVTPSEMLRSAVTNYIRPQVAAFAKQTEALVPVMDALCDTPGEDVLEEAQAEFAKTALAYGRIEFLRIGPLMEDNRADRLLFWPDRRGIGLRQVQQILAEEDATATSLTSLQEKSVALQGLGALEFLLVGTGSETLVSTNGDFRCQYGATIARNLAEIAGELTAAWNALDGIAERLMRPDSGYADYRTTTESLEAIVGLVSHGIEGVRDTRVNPFITKGDKPANPRLALFWRSNQTIPMLRANIEGMQLMVLLSSVSTDQALAAEIDAAFGRALDALAQVTSPIEAAVADPVQIAALEHFVLATQDLQRLIGEDLSATLGLSVGFSSLDGD